MTYSLLKNGRFDFVCTADDFLCIVMEHCSGGDLLRRIQQQKPAQFCVGDVRLTICSYSHNYVSHLLTHGGVVVSAVTLQQEGVCVGLTVGVRSESV